MAQRVATYLAHMQIPVWQERKAQVAVPQIGPLYNIYTLAFGSVTACVWVAAAEEQDSAVAELLAKMLAALKGRIIDRQFEVAENMIPETITSISTHLSLGDLPLNSLLSTNKIFSTFGPTVLLNNKSSKAEAWHVMQQFRKSAS